ncbi:MAG: hypothetical protein R2911_12625 [Caldilineaceae bacterium]
MLDFKFQEAVRRYVSGGPAPMRCATFFADDDYYTDANSNAYSLPTFIGNHDRAALPTFWMKTTARCPMAKSWQWLSWPTRSCFSPAVYPSSITATSRVL